MAKIINRMDNLCKRRIGVCFWNIITNRKYGVWSKDKVVRSPAEDRIVPELTVTDYMWRNLKVWGNKTAIVCGDSKRTYTYDEVFKKSRIFGATLRKIFRINDNDTVAVIMPNLPEYPIVVFGILAAGGIVTTFNPIYTAYEIKRQLELSDAKVIICDPHIIQKVKEALNLAKKEVPVVGVNMNNEVCDGIVYYKELIESKDVDINVINNVKRNVDDVAFLLYSSGTTGLPKGVQLTHKNIVANCEQQNSKYKQYTETTVDHQDTMSLVLPMFHSYGLGPMMLHKLSVGIKLVSLPKFSTEAYLKTLIDYKINLLYVAPPIVLILASHPMVSPKHFEHVRCISNSAATLPETDLIRLFQQAGREIEFRQIYGLTETGPIVTMSLPGSKNYSAVGHATPNVLLRIVDNELKNLGPGEIGELLIKGPNIMKGYKNNPAADREVFEKDGWFRSGDLAKIDETGEVTIADRLKELIKVKGFQVAPAELESVLKEHPSVFDAAVVGVPDEKFGERPVAFIIVRETATRSTKDIEMFVDERVAPYKKIKEIVFVDNIPKNASGKTLRRVLKENYLK